MLLEDVLKEFIFECEMRKLSPRTVQSYNNANLRMMKYIREQYGITELEKVHHLAIKGYIQYQTEQGRAETYINRNIVCYRCFFDYCVREGYVSQNPADKVNKQKEPITMIETFNNDEVGRLIKAFKGGRILDVRNQLIMVMLFDTGIRNSEMCNLKMEDIRDTKI